MRANGGGDCAHGVRQAHPVASERRQRQRRRLSNFQWDEKRSGFDNRRRPSRSGPAAILALPRRLAASMRENPLFLIKILLLFNVYNIADYFLTINALAAGHQELNPVMRSLLAVDPLLAGIFKIGTGLAVTALIWHYRRFRLILQFSLVSVALYLLILAYHFYGVVFHGGSLP